MIDRKLLKTNRWFDEEFLQARMTNACFNGGGGGDGDAGDDFFGGDDDVAGDFELDDRGAAERNAMAAQIDAQMAQDARNREMAAIDAQMAAQDRARQAAQIDAQMAAQDRARQAAAIDAQMAQDERNRTAAAIDAQMAQDERNRTAAAIDAQMAQQDRARQMASIDATMGQQDRERQMAAIDATMGQQDRSRQMAEIDAMMAGDQTRRDIAADTTAGGFLDTTRSPSPEAYVDVLGSEQGLYDATTANINAFGEQFGPNHAFNRLTREEQMRAMDRFHAGPSSIANMFNLSDASRMANLANSEMDMRTGPGSRGWDRDDSAREWHANNRGADMTGDVIGPTTIPGPGPDGTWSSCFVDGVQVELADGTEKNVAEISVGDVVKTQEGDGSVVKVFHSKAGKQKLYGFNDKEPFVTEAHPFMTQDGWKKVSELEVGDTLYRNGLGLDTVDSIESKEIPEDTPVYNFHVDKQENYYADGYLVHNKTYPGPGPYGPGPYGPGPYSPGPYSPGPGPYGPGPYGPGSGGGGGGYPPTWGAGGRTGGGMPGYMANYPIHSQNLFNFTPARAMPGIDPSYQPWMQPAQGMDHNLWNYQAPNLLPWDMTNRVPWNFATTPTGQYGPMVSTVGGEPAERGDR